MAYSDLDLYSRYRSFISLEVVLDAPHRKDWLSARKVLDPRNHHYRWTSWTDAMSGLAKNARQCTAFISHQLLTKGLPRCEWKFSSFTEIE
jgi:hypothetical protein